MIILTTTNKVLAQNIDQFKEGSIHQGGKNQPHKDLFIEHYGLGSKNNKSMTFVLKDNGIAWCYVAADSKSSFSFIKKRLLQLTMVRKDTAIKITKTFKAELTSVMKKNQTYEDFVKILFSDFKRRRKK